MNNDILTMTAEENDKMSQMIAKIEAARAANAKQIEGVVNNVSAVADSITGKLADIAKKQADILAAQQQIDAEISAIIEGMKNNEA